MQSFNIFPFSIFTVSSVIIMTYNDQTLCRLLLVYNLYDKGYANCMQKDIRWNLMYIN